MRYLFVVFMFALSGCASTPEQARGLTTLDLCRIIGAPLRGDAEKINAMNEVKSRGEDCSQYFAMKQMENQNMEQSLRLMEVGAGIMQNSSPSPNPTPIVHCTTTQQGNFVNTTCQ
jgi:hypothetical protein